MLYKLEFEVRDSELDMQGVVNNSNYFVYMEHARHQFAKTVLNIDFVEMTKAKQNLFLVSSQIDFKKSLLPNNKFYVTCELVPEGKIRFNFKQEIRLLDNTLIAKAINTVVCIDANKNRACVPESLKQYFLRFGS